jgi:hypothetical protein
MPHISVCYGAKTSTRLTKGPLSVPPAATTPKSCSATGAAATGNGSYVVLSTLTSAAGVMLSPSGTCQLMLTATDLYIRRNSDSVITYLARGLPPDIGPRHLMLTSSGALVLQDASGLAHWASTGACANSSSLSGKCFFAQMQDDCSAAVRDEASTIVWRFAAGTPISPSTSKQQLVSYGSPPVSCIDTNASYISFLYSGSQRYRLLVSRQGRAEIVDTANTATVWVAVGQLVATGVAQLCLQPNGSLRISSRGRTLWVSSYMVPAANASVRYTAVIMPQGSLRVFDSTCRDIFLSHVSVISSPPSEGVSIIGVPSRSRRPPPSPAITATAQPPPRPTTRPKPRPPPRRPSTRTPPRRAPPPKRVTTAAPPPRVRKRPPPKGATLLQLPPSFATRINKPPPPPPRARKINSVPPPRKAAVNSVPPPGKAAVNSVPPPGKQQNPQRNTNYLKPKAPPPHAYPSRQQAQQPPPPGAATLLPVPGKTPLQGPNGGPTKVKQGTVRSPPQVQQDDGAVQPSLLPAQPRQPTRAPASGQAARLLPKTKGPPKVEADAQEPPPAQARPAPPGVQCQAVLPSGAPCGGISLCGLDGVCPLAQCCQLGLRCSRISAFDWHCV